ncbi:enoyl-CoA hydratase/isomerase family protein [Sphaerisporangium sp. NPDC051011]|uniref:enoyl-CoA hydratase/isomerase family protein n=1 Tax=Sphaerisporangium sp. NPDC051011 TaxID=3155792 RepID=UPI0033E0CB7C
MNNDASAASLETVRIRIDGPVATVRLARPHRLNAITFALLRELRDALEGLGRRGDVRAIVLTGEGRAFCAGLDLDEGLADPAVADPVEAMHAGMQAGAAVTQTLRSIRQPVVAAIRGHAVGAGFSFAAAADLRIAAPDARFSAPFLRLGMTAGDFGLSWLLPRHIGYGRAAHLFLTGGSLDAEQALACGLVSAIDDDPLAAATRLAEQIAAAPAFGAQGTKALVDAGLETSLSAHLASEARAQTIGALSGAAQKAFADAATKK